MATAARRGGLAEHAWERQYERPWEAIEEDAAGMLKLEGLGGGGRGARGAGRDAPRVALQRGLLRNVFLVIDASRAAAMTDLRPSRLAAVEVAAGDFVREFFDQNPISTLGLIVCRGGLAEKVTDLSGNPKRHAGALKTALSSRPCDGDFSFENALSLSLRTLALQPPVATREVIIVHSALSSCDPGDLFAVVRNCVDQRVRVSVISLPGEVYVAARITRETGGSYTVPQGFDALTSQLLAHCAPPPRREEAAGGVSRSGMIRVGFPELQHESEALCACHDILRSSSYACPRCQARVCEVPTECPVCGLRLLSAPTLARSYHHIYPVPPFTHVPDAMRPGRRLAMLSASGADAGAGAGAGEAMLEDGRDPDDDAVLVGDSSPACLACCEALSPDTPRFVCPDCCLAFCSDCDMYIHDSLHTCPGCVVVVT